MLGLFAVILVSGWLWLSRVVSEHTGLGVLGTPTGSSIPVLVQLDNVQLRIPKNYFVDSTMLQRATSERPYALLLARYPGFEGYTTEKRDEFLRRDRPDSLIVTIGVGASTHSEESLREAHGTGALKKMTSAEARTNRRVRAPDRAELPGFEIYTLAKGPPEEVVYAKAMGDKLVIATCTDHRPNPTCIVYSQWYKNIRVRYHFKRPLLPQLDKLHSGIERLLGSFRTSASHTVEK